MSFVLYTNSRDDLIITSEASESACLTEVFATHPDSGSKFIDTDYDGFSEADQFRWPLDLHRYTKQVVTGSHIPLEAHTYRLY